MKKQPGWQCEFAKIDRTGQNGLRPENQVITTLPVNRGRKNDVAVFRKAEHCF
jgi:hypothetical protein